MIDKQLIQETSYSDFAPIFNELYLVIDKLNAHEIRSIVGDRPMNLVEDTFVLLVLATYKALET